MRHIFIKRLYNYFIYSVLIFREKHRRNKTMVFVSSFCFYFSSRLGSIIVGIFNMIQILMWLGIFINEMSHSQELSDRINTVLTDEDKDLLYTRDLLTNIKDDPTKYLSYGISFFVIFGISCAAMIYGAYKLKSFIVVPFIIIDFIYITILLIFYIIALLILKENEVGLGPLILYSILGEFLFLYKYYTWFVVFGYWQIVYDLEKQGDKVKIFNPGTENYPLYSRKY